MFGIGKKDKGKGDEKKYDAANKVIGMGNKFGMQDAMKQAFMSGLPDSLSKMISNLQKKMGRMPTFAECEVYLHAQGGFMKSCSMMGVDSEQINDVLQEAYDKVSKKI